MAGDAGGISVLIGEERAAWCGPLVVYVLPISHIPAKTTKFSGLFGGFSGWKDDTMEKSF